MQPFKNEPFTDFSSAANRSAMEKALASVESGLGQEYPLIIGGERVTTAHFIETLNPAHKTQILARFHGATSELAKRAVDVAHNTFKTWSQVSAAKRSDYLCRAAKIIRDRKHEFSATMVFEVGKTWSEA